MSLLNSPFICGSGGAARAMAGEAHLTKYPDTQPSGTRGSKPPTFHNTYLLTYMAWITAQAPREGAKHGSWGQPTPPRQTLHNTLSTSQSPE